jgi:hypothetical protein
LLGMGDFRVELHGVEAPLFVGHPGNRTAVGACHELEARRKLGDFVAMAHPDIQHAVAFCSREVGNVFEQRGVTAGPYRCKPELPLVPALHLAAQLVRHRLHAIADAQHRNPQIEHGLGRLVGRVFVHAGMAARQDDALERAVRRILPDPVIGHVAGMDLAIHMGFAHPPGDQLRDL